MTVVPAAADIRILPVDEVALWFLHQLATREGRTFQRLTAITEALKSVGERVPSDRAYKGPQGSDEAHAAQAISEAWDWLRSEGLVAEAMFGGMGGKLPVDGFYFVTRLGQRVAGHPRAREWRAAENRLGLELHPRLEERARRQFVLGEFAAAALVAMREVEIAVRQHGGFGPEIVGTDLMNRAFNEQSGPLTDPAMTSAERQGVQSLFRGAIAVFKNPASHRRVDVDNPTEAAEIVLLADLLLRIVDRRVDQSNQ